jgi:hypothetical protein
LFCTASTNTCSLCSTGFFPFWYFNDLGCKACTNVPNATTVTCTTATNQIATGCETNYVLLGGGCYGCTATKDAYQIATCSC